MARSFSRKSDSGTQTKSEKQEHGTYLLLSFLGPGRETRTLQNRSRLRKITAATIATTATHHTNTHAHTHLPFAPEFKTKKIREKGH